MSATNYAILIFYHPTSVNKKHEVIFNSTPIILELDKKNGSKIFEDAIKCLLGDQPKPNETCPWCTWHMD